MCVAPSKRWKDCLSSRIADVFRTKNEGPTIDWWAREFILLVTRCSGQTSAVASSGRLLPQIVGGITTLIASTSLSLLAFISSATCLNYIPIRAKKQSVFSEPRGVL